MSARPLTGQALVAARQTVLTGRGRIPVEQVRVGDWALSGAGSWALVMSVWRVMYRGPMTSLRLEGRPGGICVTLNQRIAVGPDMWARAERLRLGAVVAVPLMQLPPVPPEEDLFVAWLDTVSLQRRHRLRLRTPWGLFGAEVVASGRVFQPLFGGRYRNTPEGLVRLGELPADGLGNSAVLPEVFFRLNESQWNFDPSEVVSSQSTLCTRTADRIQFGRPLRPGRHRCVAIPRRVVSFICGDYVGPAYSVTLDAASSLVVSGLLALHGGHFESVDGSAKER